MKVPWSMPDISQDEINAVINVVKSGWLSMGSKVKEFEKSLCEYIGCKHAVMVNNGTSALLATYLATGLGQGDYVIVPDYTFIATVNTLLILGAKPITVDIDSGTFNIDTTSLDDVLTNYKDNIKALIAVDVAGMPCDYDRLAKLCEDYGIQLIEDAAEALGAEYRGKKIGSFDWPTTLSFHAAKQMTTIEGGAIVTNDKELSEKLEKIRSHGEDPVNKYWHTTVGLNLRPLDIQGALGLTQLKKVDRYIENRKNIVKFYNEELDNYLIPQKVPPYVTRHPYMFYIARLRKRYAKRKNKLLNYLNKQGADYRIPWPPIHLQPCSRDKVITIGPLLNAETVFEQAISLPLYNSMKLEEAQHVVKLVKGFFGSR